VTGRRRPIPVALPLAVWEREGLAAALIKAGLPAEDVTDPTALFWRFEHEDGPVGFGGLDIHGDQALLRSVVTLPPVRNRGIGTAIVALLELEARVRGCRDVWLLTDTAVNFFDRLGYRKFERADVPAALQKTAQFVRLCPASATAMMKRLD
jgi:N-acetylglutamate synthase-like GNAT family acetyltransferase